jgi:hypothetical protein
MILGHAQSSVNDSPDHMVVRAITFSEDRKFAIVGIHTVQEGDIVPGTKIRVKRINPKSVEFEKDGKTWIQKVQGENQ